MVQPSCSTEAKIADSSAKAELYALSCAESSHKAGRNFRLLVCESLAEDICYHLGELVTSISMGNYPPRGAKASDHTYLRQHREQLADAMTNPTTAPINAKWYPLWGLAPFMGKK